MRELQWARIVGLHENGEGIAFSSIKMINQWIMTRIKSLTHENNIDTGDLNCFYRLLLFKSVSTIYHLQWGAGQHRTGRRRKGEILHWKGGQAVDWAAQGGSGVTTPGRAQGMTACGIQCYSLLGVVVFYQTLGSMTLGVFSNLTDSMVPWFVLMCSSSVATGKYWLHLLLFPHVFIWNYLLVFPYSNIFLFNGKYLWTIIMFNRESHFPLPHLLLV